MKYGEKYVCVHDMPSQSISKGDIVVIDTVDYINDYVIIKHESTGRYQSVIIGKFLTAFNIIEDSIFNYYNEPKCDCGSWVAYGKNNDSQLHAHWCSLRKNDTLK